jgi:hypothetical protein
MLARPQLSMISLRSSLLLGIRGAPLVFRIYNSWLVSSACIPQGVDKQGRPFMIALVDKHIPCEDKVCQSVVVHSMSRSAEHDAWVWTLVPVPTRRSCDTVTPAGQHAYLCRIYTSQRSHIWCRHSVLSFATIMVAIFAWLCCAAQADKSFERYLAYCLDAGVRLGKAKVSSCCTHRTARQVESYHSLMVTPWPSSL